uniref:Uncharacterized protein n=1 Tax=Macaca fascicularis TaxID=9541 RepID=A0A7N9DB78_MACFA
MFGTDSIKHGKAGEKLWGVTSLFRFAGEETDVWKAAGVSGDTPSPAAFSLHTLPDSDKPERKPTMQDCPCGGSSCGPISTRFQGPHHSPGPQAKATPVSLPSWEWEEPGPALSCLPPGSLP